MDPNSAPVWLPDPGEGYLLAKIVDIGQDSITAKTFSHPIKTIQAPYNSTYPSEENNDKDVNDNCALMYLNEATLLNNLRVRYKKDAIYTYVANILIAINPYVEMGPLYSSDQIKRYQGKSLGVLAPHVFAIADKAFRDMRALKESQSVIVSGESGAGKTESTKYVLRYLCESWGSQVGEIEKLILSANPLLEAFGNAKTVRNNNSSRFGKFIEIHFNGKHSVVGGYISHYLLEKSRICGQSPEERNYHIFYQLCAGLESDLWSELGLGSPDQFHYLSRGSTRYFCSKELDAKVNGDRKSAAHKKSGPVVDPIVDDVKDLKATDASLRRFGVSDKERVDIYKIVAAVLHLGNVGFEDSPDDKRGGCRVKDGPSTQSLKHAATLLGIDSDELNQCLLSRVMQTSKGGHKGTVYLVPLKVHEAQNARDALSKAVYSKLFDYLVRVINKSIPFAESAHYIGVLDIAGFEYFRQNSFEQFCINYCNEKLQQFFNERILKEEQFLYEREGLGLKKIEFVDNQDCIDVLELRGSGVFDLLDEESKLPKPSPSHFTETVHSKHQGHFRLDVPRKSKLKEHRELRDDEGFLVRHFAGAVCYQTMAFIEKNSDALHGSLSELMTEANHQLVRDLFTKDTGLNNGSNGVSAKATTGKLAFVSVGSRFRTQLAELMSKLNSTGTHFIRCIKPNLTMVPKKFEGGHILSQLRCSGTGSVLELMQQGYPSRAAFADLYAMYSQYLPPELARLDPRLFCKLLFKALGLNDQEFKFGITKVFFRPGKFAEFDQIMKSDPDNLAQLVKKVRKWLLVTRWKKAIWCALAVVKLKNKILVRREFVIRLQKNCRMFLCQAKYRPRYLGLLKLRKLGPLIEDTSILAGKLKSPEERREQLEQTHAMRNKSRYLFEKIRADEIKPEAIKNGIDELNRLINQMLDHLRGKINEEERLLKLEQEMTAERLRKEREEQAVKEQADMKRRKAEMEEKRIQETMANLATISSAPKPPSMNEVAATEAARRTNAVRLQQEQQDHELALRLARENGNSPDSLMSNGSGHISPVMLQRSPAVLQQREALASKKHDLSKWKYSELRDTINTSCDIELLEACREEFHRRLKVYHEWKAKNLVKDGQAGNEFEERAPQSIMQNAAISNPRPVRPANNSGDSRYFRIPFVRPSVITGQKGWWFAHFEGQWIARQMELHPEKLPILLAAGKDDMQMCELSLEETRLTTKRGAEILPEQFEEEWTKNGGQFWKKGTASSPSNNQIRR